MILLYSRIKTILYIILIFLFTEGVSYSQPRYMAVQSLASISKQNFTLYQNYPNPFNPETTIKYALKQKGFVSMKVFSILGKEVSTLVYEEKPAGSYEVKYNAENLPSGIYLYQLNVNGNIQTKRFILLK